MNKEHIGKNINLKNYIDYQDGSIVSKILMKKDETSVTLFAFGENELIDTHSAPMDAMVNVLDGEAQITIANESFHLKEGDIIIMPANVPHSLKAITAFKMLLTKI